MKLIVYGISTIIGFAVGHYFFEGATAAYVALLLSYHLYLAYLVVSASHKKALSMSIGTTLLYHLCFLGLVLGIAYGRDHIPFFSIVKYLVPALAPFETQWLFSGKDKQADAVEKAPTMMAEATIDDHEAFREHMTQSQRPFRKPGISVNEEFNLWLADRQKKKAQAEALAAAQSAQAGVSADSGPASIK